MALIKSRNTGGLVTRGFEDLGDLKHEAAEIVAAARARAAEILDATQAEAATLLGEATPRGLAEGREQGLAEGRAEGERLGREEAVGQYTAQLESLTASWTAVLGEFETDRHDMVQAARQDIVELALTMGGRIARRVIEADPDVVKDQVAAALSLVTAPTRVTVSINPQDRTLVTSVLPALCERLATSADVELRDDPDIERGGCVLTTGSGRIDATVQTQVQRMAEALLPDAKANHRRKGA